MKVLIVDDESGTVNAIRASLTSCGYEVAIAETGHEALDRIRQSLEAAESVDVLITDFIMPGMNGLDLIREARKLLPDLPAILITAYGISDVRKDAINLDHCKYLEKPFDLINLRSIIEASCNNGKRLH